MMNTITTDLLWRIKKDLFIQTQLTPDARQDFVHGKKLATLAQGLASRSIISIMRVNKDVETDTVRLKHPVIRDQRLKICIILSDIQ